MRRCAKWPADDRLCRRLADVRQLVYSVNMAMRDVCGWLIDRHVFLHPELTKQPMPQPRYLAAAMRISGVILVSAVAVAITAASGIAGLGNTAFMPMALVDPLSRVFEWRALAVAGAAGI